MSTPLNGSLLKGFAILGLFTRDRSEITAATVTSELSMNAATAHRFLTTLVEAGVLTSLRRGQYCLGHRMQELGKIAEKSLRLEALVQPVIDRVARELNESVMACRLGDAGPICLAVAQSARPISVNIRVGTILPLHASAQGKLWLAFVTPKDRDAYLSGMTMAARSDNTITDLSAFRAELTEIQQKGFAVNKGENEEDIGAVSVPVFDTRGQMIVSLSAFGMLSRFDAQLEERAKTTLFQAAKEIEAIGP